MYNRKKEPIPRGINSLGKRWIPIFFRLVEVRGQEEKVEVDSRIRLNLHKLEYSGDMQIKKVKIPYSNEQATKHIVEYAPEEYFGQSIYSDHLSFDHQVDYYLEPSEVEDALLSLIALNYRCEEGDDVYFMGYMKDDDVLRLDVLWNAENNVWMSYFFDGWCRPSTTLTKIPTPFFHLGVCMIPIKNGRIFSRYINIDIVKK